MPKTRSSSAKTQPRSVRLNDAESNLIQTLRAHYPEVRTDTEMLYRIFTNGLLVTASQANLPHVEAPIYGGYNPETLAIQLERVLAPSIEFLLSQGRLTMLRHSDQAALLDGVEVPPAPIPVTVLGEPSPFVDDAADELDAFGADFLGD